jgi:hypothetical protein
MSDEPLFFTDEARNELELLGLHVKMKREIRDLQRRIDRATSVLYELRDALRTTNMQLRLDQVHQLFDKLEAMLHAKTENEPRPEPRYGEAGSPADPTTPPTFGEPLTADNLQRQAALQRQQQANLQQAQLGFLNRNTVEAVRAELNRPAHETFEHAGVSLRTVREEPGSGGG